MAKIKRARPRRINHLCYAKLIAYLQECPATVDEAAEASCLSVPTARRIVLALHKERAIRVVGWEQDTFGRYTTKVYLAGRGTDAKKPPPARARETGRRADRERAAQIAMQNAIAGVGT